MASFLPETSRRVEVNSSEAANRRIATETMERVRRCASNPDQIEQRLRELDREWDMERTLETNASALALTGTLLGAFVDRRFLVIPAVVTGFLLQHALQGWCPPVPFFRKRGVRTAAEIERERMALKALRGDFQAVPAKPTPWSAEEALAAAEA
jgi:hypothetical protein